jgi:hypothetical protein
MIPDPFLPKAAHEREDLWPNPFEAPEVPASSTLDQWLRTSELERDRDLTAQINESVHCQRALQVLSLRDMLLPSETPPDEEQQARLLAVRGLLQQAPIHPPHQEDVAAIAQKHMVGSLCPTTSVVEHFDPACSDRAQHRQTSNPLDVLLVGGPYQGDEDTVWRCIAASSSPSWPAYLHQEDDLLVHALDGSEWVAHLWLSYNVSEAQLLLPISQAHDSALEAIELSGLTSPSGLPIEPECSPEVQLERDRLAACARFLPATADAREHQAKASLKTKLIQFPSPAENVRTSLTSLIPLAARGGGVTHATVFQGLFAELLAQLESGKSMTFSPFKEAAPLSPLRSRDGNVEGQWDVTGLPLQNDTTLLTFVLLDRQAWRWAAVGEFDHGIATVLGGSATIIEQAAESGGNWLIIICQA